MVNIREPDSHKKVKLSTTISPYQKKRMDEFIEKGEFNSAADFTGNCFGEFIGRYDQRKELMSLHEDVQELREQVKELTNIVKSLKNEEKNKKVQ